LTAEADKRHFAGEHAVAVNFYNAALNAATGDRRAEILRAMARCVSEIDDPREALQAALPIVDGKAPELSFGKYDYLVAKAIVSRTYNIRYETKFLNDSRTWIQSPSDEDKPRLELALARLNLFLGGNDGTSAERNEATEMKESVLSKLRAESPAGTPLVEKSILPTGSLADLRSLQHDPKSSPWARAKATFAVGKALAESNDTAAALNAYHEAYELARSVFPFYPGHDPDLPPPQPEPPQFRDPELYLLSDVVAAIHKLDPSWPDPLRGGLRFRLTGVKLPADVSITCRALLLAPPGGSGLDQISNRWGHILMRTVELRDDRTGWIGVADGHYNVEIRQAAKSLHGEHTGDDAFRIFHLLESDLSGLPKELEMNGKTIDMPPVRLSLLKEIKLQAPSEGAPVDLQETFFRWSSVQGASLYRVSFTIIRPQPKGVGTSSHVFGPVESRTNAVCLGTQLADRSVVGNLAKELKSGITGSWSVQAYDAQNRRIATSVGDARRFLVARDLEVGK
jgi:hypothetical protein